jgi:uncharacterized protein with ParB-like and HNH nuclease domain
MKANETNLNKFLSQNDTQFVIPVYQRNYDWKHSQCKQFIDDILEVGDNKNIPAHFLGSIVYVHDDLYTTGEIDELVIIDGQQRLTTLTLVYIVLYKLAQKLEDGSLENRINETYLINKFAEDEEKLKLRPTENNDVALKFLLSQDGNEDFQEFSKLVENYNYLESRINRQNYKVVLHGIDKLVFVEISLDRRNDNPQKIFESLNSTGLELSQADLIRNYILMGLDNKTQKNIYENYWKKIEHLAKDNDSNESRVSDFMRDYLTNENKKIPIKKRVYEEFKAKYPVQNVHALKKELGRIKLFTKYYNKLINPENEDDKEIKEQINYIKKLGSNVTYPFLLRIYDDFEKDIIDKKVFINVLETVQSFVWRRFIISLPSNSLNKIFMRLYEDVNLNNYLESIQIALLKKKGTQRFPRNTEVKNALKEKDIYSSKARNRLYLLERLENYKNRETVEISDNSNIIVEHIFPQNPDPRWENMLQKDEYNELEEKYINTLANLTLSGNNGSLGNRYFTDKRDMNIDGKEQGYKFSRLWLNKYLSAINEWNIEKLDERFGLLIKRFFKIWQFPDVNYEINEKFDEVDIFEAENPTGKKIAYAIFLDQKVEPKTVTDLYTYVFRILFDLQPRTFFTTDLSEQISLTKDHLRLRNPKKLNETYFIEANIANKGKFDKIKYALKTFDLEDELTIRYKEEG